jgi:outer membrane lipoprotein-sorting protein
MEYREMFATYIDGLLAEQERIDLEVHISICDECRKELSVTRRLTSALSARGRKIAGAAASLEERVMDEIGKKDNVSDTRRKHSLGIDWSHIMKNHFAKLAIAAVFVIGALTGVYYFAGGFGGSGVAWGEVERLVSGIENMSFKISTKVPVNGAMVEGEAQSYQSKQYGMRVDTYMAGKVMMTMYRPVDSDEMVTVMPESKQYMRMKMTPEMAAKMDQKNQFDPRGFVKWMMGVKYVSLGRSVVDGVEVEGRATDGSEAGMGMFEKAEAKLWVDVKTDLPVRMEIKGTMPNGKDVMEMTMYGFDWSNNIDPSYFTVSIPEGYKQIGGTVVMGMPSEEAMLKGLRTFAELSGGKYPQTLSPMNITQETTKLMVVQMKGSTDVPDGMMQKMMDMNMAAQSYSKLVADGKSPEYFGKDVTASDADQVLLRWKSGEGKVKVVYGDLRVEEIADTNAPETPAQQ